MSKRIYPIFALIIFGLIYYYFFVSTLMVSQITGKTDSPRANILINLFDFDTGLTRYDMYRLSKKAPHWNSRIRQIRNIKNIHQRQLEEEKLMAEMMRDPGMKKITRKFLGFGAKSSMAILQAASGFKSFCLF